MSKYGKGIGRVYTKKIGNWAGVTNFFAGLGLNVERQVKRAQKEEAVEFKKALVRAIVTQKYAGTSMWPPLKPKTRYRKKDNKNSIYMETEKYVNNIVVKIRGNAAIVGFRDGVTYKKKGQRSVTLEQVAIWMEYGTNRSPARPLWAPTLKERGGTRAIRDRIADKLFNRIKRLAQGTPIVVNRGDIRKRF